MESHPSYVDNSSFQQALHQLSLPCKADVDSSLNSRSHSLSASCATELRTSLSRLVPSLPPLPPPPPPSVDPPRRSSRTGSSSPSSSPTWSPSAPSPHSPTASGISNGKMKLSFYGTHLGDVDRWIYDLGESALALVLCFTIFAVIIVEIKSKRLGGGGKKKKKK